MGNDIKHDNQSINTGYNDGINEPEQPTISDIGTNQASGNGNVAKRGRGRPKGSKNKSVSNGLGSNNREGFDQTATTEEPSTSETPIFVQGQKGKKRGRKPLVKKIENPGETAEKVIDTIELAAIRFIGEEARLEPFERFLIEIGATDTVSKVSPETAARVASIVSPICLIGGIALYGFRMAGVVASRMETEKHTEIKQTASTFEQEQDNMSEPVNATNGFNLRETVVPPMSNLNNLTKE